MKVIKLIMLLLSLLILYPAHSQKLQDNYRITTYTYIFKLDSSSAAEIYNKRILLDSLKYFSHPVDSFGFDKAYDYNKLNPGHYLFLSGEENNVRYSLFEQPVFKLHALGVNNLIYVFATNLSGEQIKDARLKLIKDGTIIHFHEDCGCYPIPLPKKKNLSLPLDFLLIKGADFTYGSYSYNSPEPRIKKRWKWFRRPVTSSAYSVALLPGYLVLNQPKFKLLDTLKWKAFLLKPNGKAYRKPVRLNILDGQTGVLLRSELIKASMPGAYNGKFILADSLIIDRQYPVKLLNRKGQELKTEYFTIENYDLKKSFYEATLNKNYFYAGEGVQFTVSAFDANKLPLLDAKIKVVVSMSQLIEPYRDSLFIPFSWSEKYWEYTRNSDPSGVSIIHFPDSLLFNAQMQFNATITISNTEGESRTFNLAFTYNPQVDRYLFTQERDSIKAVFLHNSKPVSKKVTLRAYNTILLNEKEVTLPYNFKVDDYSNNYSLVSGKDIVANLLLDDYLSNSVGFDGLRTYDSIRINMINPLGITVHYKIYYGDELLQGGSGSTLDFFKKMPSDRSFHVVYSYRWKGIEYVKEQSFHSREKELTVEIGQPEVIYPGQKVAVDVHVTDYRNRNVNKVNLTAYALNEQLGNLKDPDLPYLGKSKTGILKSFQLFEMRAVINNYKTISPLYLNMPLFARSPFYKLVYSPSGLGKVYEDIQSEKAEFSPYIVKGLENQTIYSVYADKKLVYLANTTLRNPFSFQLDPGTYDLDLRTYKGMYTLKKVELLKGKKLFLCLRIDSISKTPLVTYVNLDPPFLKEEKAGISERLLFFSFSFAKKPGNYYLAQGDRVFSGASVNHYTLFSGTGGYYVAGPLERGEVQLIWPGKDSLKFYFEPGSAYIFYDDSIVVKEIPSSFSKFPEGISQIAPANYMLLNERPFAWPVKIEKPVENALPPPSSRKIRTHPALHDYGNNWNEKPLANLFMKNVSGMPITKVWLFNKEEDKYSRICFNPCFSVYNLKPGKYDIIIQTDRDSICRFKDYLLQPEGTSYKFLKASEFLPYDSLLIAEAEERIVKLNRPLPRKFDNPPITITDVKRTVKETREENKITGYIFDQNGNPIDMITVFFENAGVFVAGAVTNQMGYFEMNAGKNISGQLKIFFNGKFYHYCQLFLASGKNTELQVQLPTNEGKPYAWGTTVDVSNYMSDNKYYLSASPSGTVSYMAAPVSMESVVSTMSGSIFKVSGLKFRSIGLNFNQQDSNEPSINQESTAQPVKNKFKEFLEKIKGDTNANRIRSNFRDYAYFIPNLLTNKKGEAHFTVIFPDNQTSWKTFVPAMDYHKRSGLGVSEIKAYKPVNTTLALPKFMIVNDSIKAIGKIFNYSDKEVTLTSTFNLAGKIKSSRVQTVKTFLSDSLYLKMDSSGSFPVVYSFVTSDNYIDGEKRSLFVLGNGTEVVNANCFLSENDTSFELQKDSTCTKIRLTLTNSQLDLVLGELEKLKTYNYGCNEQNASKLKALLTEKTICLALGKEFKEDKLIVRIVHRLEQTQRKDGSWGWWNTEDQPEYWMTCYIIEALEMAVKAGFHTRAHIRGAEYLKANIDKLTPTDRLYAIQILSDFYAKLDYKKQVESFDKRNLSLQDHFRLIRLKQIINIPYYQDTLLLTMTTDRTGIFWGENVLNFKTNIITTSALAYQLLKHDSIDHQAILRKIRRYFLTHSEIAHNTIEQAVMIESLVKDILAENKLKQELLPELMVDGKVYSMPTSPQIITITKAGKTLVQKRGAPVCFSISNYKLDKNPKVVDSLFRISSHLEQKNKTTLNLKKSVPVDYKVEIYAIKAAEYVMIEIPIPSSCYYSNKSAGKLPFEVNREYFDDKVVVFCRNLPQGHHKLNVELQPLFEGRSTVLPVKVSLMYYPDHYGINSKSEVWVKE